MFSSGMKAGFRVWLWLGWVTLALVPLGGCVRNKAWQSGRVQPVLPEIGAPKVGVPVAVVEFDDMGELWDRCELDDKDSGIADRQAGRRCELRDALAFIRTERLRAESEERDAVVITYVHGWHHDAESKDQDFQAFSEILKRLQDQSDCVNGAGVQGSSDVSSCVPQRVRFIGAYVAWRGEVIRTFLKYATAFDREKAGQRTALVSMSEVLVRLRNAAKQTTADTAAGEVKGGSGQGRLPEKRARFLLFGHSYGGMIVERSMSQMLTAALLPEHKDTVETCDGGGAQEPFADLVLLINPAGDAIETEQLIDLMKRARVRVCSPTKKMSVPPPLIVSIHARNDFWTGEGFAIGHTLESVDKAFRPHTPCEFCDDGARTSPTQGYVYRHTGGAVAYFNNYCYIDSTPTGDPVCERVRAVVDGLKAKAGVAGKKNESSYETAKSGGKEVQEKVVAATREFAAFPKAAAETPNASRILNLYKRFDPCEPLVDRPCVHVEPWNDTPYWIFTVPKTVVDKHTGFWTEEFTEFVTNIIDVTTPVTGTRIRVQ